MYKMDMDKLKEKNKKIFIYLIIIGSIVFFSGAMGQYYINLISQDATNEHAEAIPVSEKWRGEPVIFYTIQVGAFESEEDAKQLVQKLRLLGYKPVISENKTHKVLIGIWRDKWGAESELIKFKNISVTGFITSIILNNQLSYNDKKAIFNPIYQEYISILCDLSDIIFLPQNTWGSEAWYIRINSTFHNLSKLNDSIADIRKSVEYQEISEELFQNMLLIQEVQQAIISWQNDISIKELSNIQKVSLVLILHLKELSNDVEKIEENTLSL